MFCSSCGSEIPEGSKFCTSCGAPIETVAPVEEVVAEVVTEEAAPADADPVFNPVQSVNTEPQYDYSETVYGNVEAAPTEQKGMSIASMVLGIIGILAWCIPCCGYPIGITGLILGIVGRKKGGKSYALAGIICSIICLVASLINSILGAMSAASIFSNL